MLLSTFVLKSLCFNYLCPVVRFRLKLGKHKNPFVARGCPNQVVLELSFERIRCRIYLLTNLYLRATFNFGSIFNVRETKAIYAEAVARGSVKRFS